MIRSEHSLVEKIGAPPPPVKPEQKASVRSLLRRFFPSDSVEHALARHELDQMILSDVHESEDSQVQS